MKTGLREGRDLTDDPVEHAPFACAAGRSTADESIERMYGSRPSAQARGGALTR
jgi:hypothetical protein